MFIVVTNLYRVPSEYWILPQFSGSCIYICCITLGKCRIRRPTEGDVCCSDVLLETSIIRLYIKYFVSLFHCHILQSHSAVTSSSPTINLLIDINDCFAWGQLQCLALSFCESSGDAQSRCDTQVLPQLIWGISTERVWLLDSWLKLCWRKEGQRKAYPAQSRRKSAESSP